MKFQFSFMLLCVSVFGFMLSVDAAELLQGPDQLTVRLKGDAFFWITWTTEDGATLTISKLLRLENTNLWTDVLLVNGTEYEPRNNWVNKATADIENGTDVSSVNVTLKGVTFDEQGQYKMRIQGEGQPATESPSNTAYFTINTYDLPIGLELTSDRSNFNESMEAVFVCSGNIGRPLGRLRLIQASSSLPDYFGAVETIDNAEMERLFSNIRLNNGTYQISHRFSVITTRQDNDTIFKCDIVHEIPTMTVKQSNAVPIFVNCK